MIDAGILAEDDRLELIEGEIIEMAPINLPHAACVTRLHILLYELTREDHTGIVWIQNPLWIPIRSRPEPDIVLLKWRDDLYAGKRPEPEDVLLLIEVSDTTLRVDRQIKVPLYARAGIPEVWIVNLNDSLIEVYAEPSKGKYTVTRQASRGESLALPDPVSGTIRADDVLG